MFINLVFGVLLWKGHGIDIITNEVIDSNVASAIGGNNEINQNNPDTD